MKMMQICALLCLIVGLSQATVRVRRGSDSELGIGFFKGLDIKQRSNDQIGYSNIGDNRETNKNFHSIIKDQSGPRREFVDSENESFGLHINTATSIAGKIADVRQELTSIFNNSSRTSATVQLGIGISGSVSSSHESTHIENIKNTHNGNKNKLTVLLSSGSIAVSSHNNYTSNIQKNSFSASETRSTGSESSASSNVIKKEFISNSNTRDGNIGYNINNGGYQHFGNKNNDRDITAVGNHEQQYLNTAGQEGNFIKSTSLATSGSSDIFKATRIPLQDRPLLYGTSRHDSIDDNNRSFNINTGDIRSAGGYDETGTNDHVTNDHVTIGSNFNGGFEKNVGSNFKNSETGNTNSKHTSGKNEYGISSGSNFVNTKRLDSVFVSNKIPENNVIPIITRDITPWDAENDQSSHQSTSQSYRDNYMNTGVIKNPSNSGGSHCHDENFVTIKNHRNQEANSRVQGRYKSNNEGQGTHLGDSESRVGPWIINPENNKDDGLKSNSRGTEGAGSHQVISKTYINSLSGHKPSHWSTHVEHKMKFGGNENQKNNWYINGNYRRNLENSQRKENHSGSSDIHNRQDSGNSEMHGAQRSGNVKNGIYLKETNNRGVNWNNRKMDGESKDHENEWEYSHLRYGITPSNINRNDNNAYIQSFGGTHAMNNEGNIYENQYSGGNSHRVNLHNVGSTTNIASYHANNKGHENNCHDDKRHITNSADNYGHSSQKANIGKGYNNRLNTQERHHSHTGGDESYRRHLTGTEYNNGNLGGKEMHQVYSTSQPSNSGHYGSNSGGHEKYSTDAIVYGSSSDNIDVFKGIPENTNNEHTSHEIEKSDRENHKAASESYGHQALFNKNQESYLGNSDGNSIWSTANKGQGSYLGGFGVYGSHSSSNEGYKRNWEEYEDQNGYSSGRGRYASQWSGSVGYINQWNITGNQESHSSGSAAYTSHWADNTGQRSHSAGSVGYESHWRKIGEQKRYSSSDTGHGSH